MTRLTFGLLCAAVTLSSGCSSEESQPGGILPTGGSAGAGNTAGSVAGGIGGATGGVPGSAGSSISFGGAETGGTGNEPIGGSCASEKAEADVLPVYLAFAFDVSGSMGAGDQDWHDRTLKWDPVVAASKSFFEDPASEGLSASLTFFPSTGGMNMRCQDGTYVTPNVPMATLPSTAFGMALDQRVANGWGNGTPTLHVMRGVIDFVQAELQRTPGRYVIVLVTDGYPQNCNDNQIQSVVTEAAAVAADIPTYVIGVKNPPLPEAPDTVTNLNDVALAGGTQQAYIIDTGNPEQTAAAFKGAIDAIRGSAVSCYLGIPQPPGGRTFDQEKVAVTYRSSAGTTALTYDPTCLAPNTWQYDDPINPTQIRLCPSACDMLQNDRSAALEIEFTCEQQILIPR